MKKETGFSSVLNASFYIIYLLFFVSIICAFRAVSSMAIGMLLLLSLADNKVHTGHFFRGRFRNMFFVSCISFYLLQIIALLYTNDMHEGMVHLQLKSALIFIPLLACNEHYMHIGTREKLMKGYTWILTAAICFCLATAVYKYFIGHTNNSVFFYHALVSPFRQHAIQFSILVFAGLTYLLETAKHRQYIFNVIVHFLIIILFAVFMLLLSSKLVIIFSLLYFAYYFGIDLRKQGVSRPGIAVLAFMFLVIGGIVLFTQNPISRRFKEIVSGDLRMVEKPTFDQGVYFNGLQFRLLQWRFVKEILNENKAWIIGVGPGDAQALIDKKYTSVNMYAGEPGTANRGFRGYDTHNEFLQSFLQTGIIGFHVFVAICYGLIKLAVERKKAPLSAIILLVIAYSFNESVFETQYGLTIFTFLPLFFYKTFAPPAPVR